MIEVNKIFQKRSHEVTASKTLKSEVELTAMLSENEIPISFTTSILKSTPSTVLLLGVGLLTITGVNTTKVTAANLSVGDIEITGNTVIAQSEGQTVYLLGIGDLSIQGQALTKSVTAVIGTGEMAIEGQAIQPNTTATLSAGEITITGNALNKVTTASLSTGSMTITGTTVIADYEDGGEPSAASFTSGHEYVTDRDGWMYVPAGYADNTDDYPLIIFGHGYGQRSTDVNDVLQDGYPEYLAAGDRPEGVLIFCPQIPSGDYTVTDWDNAFSYVKANYRVDLNRVCVTGLSGGGFLAREVAQNRPDDIAGIVVAAANMDSGWNWSEQTEIAHFWIHGTSDGNQTNGLQSLLNGANGVDRVLPFDTLALWGVGHTDTAWNTNVYNRKERTDQAGTATFDFIRYLLKQSKDATQRATLFVENAEETELIEDYRAAVKHVGLLSAGATKTALESRLSTLKTTIKNGGRFFLLDFGATAHGGSNINGITTAQTGQGINNIIDDEGGASSIDFSIVAQFSTTPTSRMNGTSRLNGDYLGLPKGAYTDGLRIEGPVTTGQAKFSSLNLAKTYSIRIYHGVATGNFSDEAELSATVDGITKVQYSECNTTLYLEWTGVEPNGSNEITINAEAVGTGDKNCQISVIELYESA